MKTKAQKEREYTSKVRPVILKRDNNTCQVCGYVASDLIHLQIHHVLAIYLGGETIEDNLITLCNTCHKYAPEDGWDEFNLFRQDKDGYIEKRMRETGYWNQVEDAVMEFQLNCLRQWYRAGIIPDEVCTAIEKYIRGEIEK